MPKFTPGPWKLYSNSLAPWEQHRIENDHGNHVCELMEADQPDARLIAASPELYGLVLKLRRLSDIKELELAAKVADLETSKKDGDA